VPTTGARLLLAIDKLCAEPSSNTNEMKRVPTGHLHNARVISNSFKADRAVHFSRFYWSREEDYNQFLSSRLKIEVLIPIHVKITMSDPMITKIVMDIYSNSIRIAETTRRTSIEYSWYDAKTKQISPLKVGIDCSILKTVPADFCIENTYNIIDILQRGLPDCLVDIDFHEISYDDDDVVKPRGYVSKQVASNMLKADVSALNGLGGLLFNVARVQNERRQETINRYEASISKGPYPYIVIDWSEDSDEES